MKLIKYNLIILLTLLSFNMVAGKEFSFNYTDGERYSLTIRGNYRLYKNRKYDGLRSVEIKALCSVVKKAGFYQIDGRQFYLNKKLLNGQPGGFRIEEILPINYSFDDKGLLPSSNYSFPIVQGLPFFPDDPIIEGDEYEGKGYSALELFEDGDREIIPVVIQVKYGGKREYGGSHYDYFDITYRFERTYKSEKIKRIGGFHTLKLYYDGERGRPIFMTDRFEEHITRHDNNVEKRVGFYSFFYENIIKLDKAKAVKELKKQIKPKGSDIILEEHGNELSLVINNLRFQPNSAELLPEEYKRLKEIIEALRRIENRTFMIVGHTADVGSRSAQLELSIKRAETIAGFFIKQGFDSKRIIYTGKGSEEPLAPNDSDENRKKNRRVEIVILED